MFSILIPSWNNLQFLKLCVKSIRQHSSFPHQILIHVNEGSDSTLEWVTENGIEFSYTPSNAGICVAVNMASRLAKQEYVVYMNDDMYVLPGWDKILLQEIQKLPSDCFMFSSTMIEPADTKNNCVIVAGYGRSLENFQEEWLLKDFSSLKKNDWSGSAWPPNIVHRKWWEKVGGYSEEFSPGMSSDDDFAMKMWQAGCRIYKGVGASRVYHFIAKSTGRVVKNNGRKQFLKKWGIKQSAFNKYYLRRGEPYHGPLQDPKWKPGLMLSNFAGAIQKNF